MESFKDMMTTDNLLLALAAFGAYKLVVSPVLSLLGGIYRHFLRPRLNLKRRYGENTWAMITGATNGIGLGFAEALAKEGFNIVLVARSSQKLFNCKEELEKKFPEIQVEVRKIDLMSTNIEDYIELADSVKSLDVSILINNAGYANIGPIEEEEYDELERMVKTNMGPYVYLTRSMLPRMLKREKKSGIIFTSSVSATITIPGVSTYGATKAFNDHFSQSLAYEVIDKVDVLSFKPAGVASNMYKHKPSFGVLTPLVAANGALDALGRDVETYGHWRHVVSTKAQLLPMEILPASFFYAKANDMVRKRAKSMKEEKEKKD